MEYTYILTSNIFGLKKFSQNLSGLLFSAVFGPLLDWDLGQFLIIGLGISPKMVRSEPERSKNYLKKFCQAQCFRPSGININKNTTSFHHIIMGNTDILI